jgi:hypothetical protein
MNSESSLGQRTWWHSPVVSGSNDRGGLVDFDQPDEEHLPPKYWQLFQSRSRPKLLETLHTSLKKTGLARGARLWSR